MVFYVIMGRVVAPNESFQPTRPLVTVLAGARPAPIDLAAEANVRSRKVITWQAVVVGVSE